MSDIIGLDVGEVRVGVARANTIARIPEPLVTLKRTDEVFQQLKDIISEHGASVVVVGLPRNLNGEDTKQTDYSRQFAAELSQHAPGVRIEFIDEALTSHKAKAELNSKNQRFNRSDVDALAAAYILEDYLSETANYEAA